MVWRLAPMYVVYFHQHKCLNWIISLSFCSFSYNAVCFELLKLSVSDIRVGQKGSNGDRKLHLFGRDYNFTCSLCTKIHLWAKILFKFFKTFSFFFSFFARKTMKKHIWTSIRIAQHPNSG